MTRRRHPEQDLQRVIVQWLRLTRPACLWFHPANGGARSRIEAAIFTGLGVRAGIPDLVFLWHGGCGLVELKAKGGSLSKAQRAIRAECEERGIPYVVARSLEDVQQALREWGVE